MERLMEHDIVQNSALGSLALWSFVLHYYKATGNKQGPLLPITMIVLPLAFNKQVSTMISRKNLEGGFYSAISEDRALYLGLQKRMESMSEQTFNAINIGFSVGLLKYDENTSQLLPSRRTPPYQIIDEEIKTILSTSKRLGYWFATINISQLAAILKVRF
ncbi:three component ABC system middle component [Peribacillus sp. R9-11]|uniref:three component ABC system middle component n=1 Tax=Peribacillus sp. R9-11 TaxID=3073271 RepID=UPI00286871B4|nr:three component ABC system middle component [Peribacillus sp. R9-11]WMX58966.1 DUF6521 family protein [Peribacillus sp. R9-11]